MVKPDRGEIRMGRVSRNLGSQGVDQFVGLGSDPEATPRRPRQRTAPPELRLRARVDDPGLEIAVCQGSPIHPSLHERFCAAHVVSAVGTGPYRPPCLADDRRFRHHYDGGDPDSAMLASTLATAAFRNLAEPSFDASAGSGAVVNDLLVREGASVATIIVVTDLSTTDRDDYRDALMLAHLDRMASRTGVRSFPVEVRPAANPLFVGLGRLLIGEADDADALARATAVFAVVRLSTRGDLTIVPLKAV